MKLVRLYLLWPGKINRLTFFLGYLILWGTVFVSMMALVIYSRGSLSLFSSPAQWQGFFVILSGLYLLALYSDILIKIKRLRDMNQSAWHILWIGLLAILSNVFSMVQSPIAGNIALFIYAVQIVVFAWLVFTPGKDILELTEVFE